MNFIPHNILVTGGAGFIGANFIHYYLKQFPNANIINLDALTYAGNLTHLKNIEHNPHYHFIHGNICDSVLVKQLLAQHNIDTIVHFAAESHVDNSIKAPDNFIKTNITGTFTLLEAAKSYWFSQTAFKPDQYRFHHISTDEVYGSLNNDDPAFCETTPYKPRSPYAASKASSDHLVMAYSHTYGLPVTLSNCSNNYGPYQHPEKLIPKVIQCCQDGKKIPVYGTGNNIRDWLYVVDHCEAITEILHRGTLGEKYTIGGHCEMNNLQLIKQICDLIGAPHDLISFVTDRQGHDWRYAIDTSKIHHELGWAPKTSLENGLRETLNHYRVYSP